MQHRREWRTRVLLRPAAAAYRLDPAAPCAGLPCLHCPSGPPPPPDDPMDNPTPSPGITPIPSPSPTPDVDLVEPIDSLPPCDPGNAAAGAGGGAASAATAAPLCDPTITDPTPVDPDVAASAGGSSAVST